LGKALLSELCPCQTAAKADITERSTAADILAGKVFDCVCGAGNQLCEAVAERLVGQVVKLYAKPSGSATRPSSPSRSCSKPAPNFPALFRADRRSADIARYVRCTFASE